MIKKKSVNRSIRQILAYVEKELSIEFRIKGFLITNYLNQIISILMFLIVFGVIFSIKEGFTLGYWNGDNFVLFLLLAFCIQFSKPIMYKYGRHFTLEKYWKTLSAILVAPVNRFTLLIGILLSELVIVGVVIFIIFIIAIVFFPISLFYLFLVLLMLFSIIITFSSIGLLLGVFRISREEIVPYLRMILRIVFVFSCTNYPMQIFPEMFHIFILINPFYYQFDLLRLTWYLGIEHDVAISYITPYHIISAILLPTIIPIISLYLFERVYKKHGITGY